MRKACRYRRNNVSAIPAPRGPPVPKVTGHKVELRVGWSRGQTGPCGLTKSSDALGGLHWAGKSGFSAPI